MANMYNMQANISGHLIICGIFLINTVELRGVRDSYVQWIKQRTTGFAHFGSRPVKIRKKYDSLKNHPKTQIYKGKPLFE